MTRLNRAFTLIELLVVIAIIAILAAILFPVFAQAKTAAKRTQDISNIKNLATGMILYTADHDDTLPATRVVEASADWWSPRMRIWKDAILPYVKNGGRPMNGVFNATPGNGGIWQSPLNAAAWSNADRWFGSDPGDETTRFPRSYAVSKDAGRNEFGGPQPNGRCADTIWPEIYPNGSGGQDVYNQGGNQGILEAPAATMMIVPNRHMFPDVEAAHMGAPADASGRFLGWGVTTAPFSQVTGLQNGRFNAAFFDGHVASQAASQSLANDTWGSFGPTGIPACGWTYWDGSGQPFKTGIQNWLQKIREWSLR
jgi:prepilin-type N-terminal cleavage/methylation domain-containing protein/prepilin-type processing-associated H-X9-DG protein